MKWSEMEEETSSGITKAEGGRRSPPIPQTVQHARNAPLSSRVHRVQICFLLFWSSDISFARI